MEQTCTAFAGTRRIATGSIADVAMAAKQAIDGGESAMVLIFDNLTSAVIEIDFRGTPATVAKRLPQPAPTVAEKTEDDAPRGPGRPKLGVVAREVTLLPRHWEWLGTQPGGASVALRKLVEEARRLHADKDMLRQSQDAAYRFMSAMAGNLPDFEETTRALFAKNQELFTTLTKPWPVDVRDHARKLAAAVFN